MGHLNLTYFVFYRWIAFDIKWTKLEGLSLNNGTMNSFLNPDGSHSITSAKSIADAPKNVNKNRMDSEPFNSPNFKPVWESKPKKPCHPRFVASTPIGNMHSDNLIDNGICNLLHFRV